VKLEQKLCNELKISCATLKNWQKEGLIPPLPAILSEASQLEDSRLQTLYKSYLNQIKNNIKNKLTSRANRSLSNQKELFYHGISDSGRKLLLFELVQTYEKRSLSLEEAVFALCYRQLVCEKLLSSFEDKSLIASFMREWLFELKKTAGAEKKDDFFVIFDSFYIPSCDDDIAGAFYQSVLSLSKKAGRGSFYTPKKLLQDIKIDANKSIYDPCCGSGHILLNILSKQQASELVFASDIDEVALKICRVNLCLFFNDPDCRANVFYRDLLFQPDNFSCDEKSAALVKKSRLPLFDYIVTNPPWGACFSIEEKLFLKEKYPVLNTSESFSISIYNAYRLLADDGIMHFFLPKAILNVAKHKKIRQFLLEEKCKLLIRDCGKAFKGVVSQAILLSLVKNKRKNQKLTIKAYASQNDKNQLSTFFYPKSKLKPPYYFIPLNNNSQLFEGVLKNNPYITLKNKAVFGMGLVTGNNAGFIKELNEKKGLEQGWEPIYRGKNILPYYLSDTSQVIQFKKELFQQAAAEEYYRQKKIVYRFIANHPVCCIDSKGVLLLNSANFFIPCSDLAYPWESIVCLFNSRLYEEFYKEEFASIKVLRSHIESLPLFSFSQEEHKRLKLLHDALILNPQNKVEIMDEIEKTIGEFLNLP